MRANKRFLPLALLLTLAAVALPCAAWYVMGSRSIHREQQLILNGAYGKSRDQALTLSGRVSAYLETILATENRRPFFHYQTHFHDPSSDCECSSITPSPLAHGPQHQAIWTYFQIDPDDGLSMPSLNLTLSAQGGQEWLKERARILRGLAGATDTLEVTRKNAWGSRQEIVNLKAWVQNMELAGVQCDPATVEAAVHSLSDSLGATGEGRNVVIDVGPLTWRTIESGQTLRLAARRDVRTPAGRFVQGFIVAQSYLESLLEGNATLVTEAADGMVFAPLPLEGVSWGIQVDPAPRLAQVDVEIRRLISHFRTAFTWVLAGASLAGLGLFVLVWQTDRLARERSRFAEAAAHELRTPLTSLRLYSDMMEESLGDPSKRRKYAERLGQEAKRLERVVNNVLNYARLGPKAVSLELGDLGKPIEAAVDALRPALEANGATVKLEIEPDLPEVALDEDAIFQILQNLLDNAEKYSREAEDRCLHVDVKHVSHGVELVVRDHGPGVAPGEEKHLFQAYRRGSQNGDASGLGLGLTLVQALAETHRGTVRYQANPDGGSTFVVFFPESVPTAAS